MSQQINLFTPAFRPRGMGPASAAALLGWFVIIGLCTGLYAWYQNNRTDAAARDANAVAGEFAELAARREKLTQQLASLKADPALRDELIQLEWRLKGRQDVVQALESGVVGSTRGYADFLRAFSRQAVDGLWLTGFDIAGSGNELKLEGRALSADLLPVYLKRLNQEPALQGRRFSELRMAPGKGETAGAPREAISRDAVSREDSRAGPSGAIAAKSAIPARPPYLEFALAGTLPDVGGKIAAAPASQGEAAGAAR